MICKKCGCGFGGEAVKCPICGTPVDGIVYPVMGNSNQTAPLRETPIENRVNSAPVAPRVSTGSFEKPGNTKSGNVSGYDVSPYNVGPNNTIGQGQQVAMNNAGSGHISGCSAPPTNRTLRYPIGWPVNAMNNVPINPNGWSGSPGAIGDGFSSRPKSSKRIALIVTFSIVITTLLVVVLVIVINAGSGASSMEIAAEEYIEVLAEGDLDKIADRMCSPKEKEKYTETEVQDIARSQKRAFRNKVDIDIADYDVEIRNIQIHDVEEYSLPYIRNNEPAYKVSVTFEIKGHGWDSNEDWYDDSMIVYCQEQDGRWYAYLNTW